MYICICFSHRFVDRFKNMLHQPHSVTYTNWEGGGAVDWQIPQWMSGDGGKSRGYFVVYFLCSRYNVAWHIFIPACLRRLQ